ncbi:CinA family protein [Magnetococcales bacterium HHB-1]
MQCLLVIPRWSESEGLFSTVGRPYLDLALFESGITTLHVLEIDPEAPFNPEETWDSYRVILIQSSPNSRLRRSILSNLGLSLWLDPDHDDQLRITGARTLLDAENQPVGFAVDRRGKIVIFCEAPLWPLQAAIKKTILFFQGETHKTRLHRGENRCWLAETSGHWQRLEFLKQEKLTKHCQHYPLPNGDTALIFPSGLYEEVQKTIKARLQEMLYAFMPIPLEELVGHQLIEAKKQIAVVESCTAGLTAARLASVSGSSAYLMEGFVTYSNRAKSKLFAGSNALIKRCGAVSAEVALALARGALRVTNCDIAVSITGIAGPTGGSAEKPVGTVYFAAVAKGDHIIAAHHVFSGDRNAVRLQASQTALHLIRRILLKQTEQNTK